MEEASTVDLFERPLHPYTRGLMASVPRAEASFETEA
ncbi:MAG: peptide ABC transporter ATP-binding protein, partial [Desulfobacterales bacterium]|nr:peptide ABC transporter ATP-binding protein [Desulfobacterales bacterium]